MNLQTKKQKISTLIRHMIATVLVAGISAFNLAAAADIDPSEWVSVSVAPDPLLSDLQSVPNDAHAKGMWSPVANWPLVSVHSLVMPNGKVLTYGTDAQGAFDGRYFDEWDPTKGLANNSHLTRFSQGYQNSFCSAAAYLPQGRLLISGGDTQRTSLIYTTGVADNEEPIALAGSGANMSYDRWYATMITLPNGAPLIMGGMVPYTESMADEVDTALASGWASLTPERYNISSNSWTSLLGATSRIAFGPDYNRTSYPRAWVAPNGLVFGVSAEKMWYLDPTGDGAVTEAGTFKGPYSANNPTNVGSTNTAVMYDIGKILVMGGNGRVWFDGLPASNQATSIDINGGMPVLTEQPAMTYKRRFANATVLATGDVVVLAGTETAYKDDGAVYAAEIWNPNSQSWTVGADASVFRGYHGNATLLPNGTLLSHGGGFPDPAPGLSAQIYYPPYLFKHENGLTKLAPRPTIHAISGLSYHENAPIQLDMADASAIASLTLIGVSNGTHAFNAGQRRIPLPFTQDSFRLSATLPNHNLTPPGYYQIVAIDTHGVPSLGVIIGIGQDLATPTVSTEPYTSPSVSAVTLPKVASGVVAHYQLNAENGVTYSWNFGDGTQSTPFSAVAATSHIYASSGAYVVTLRTNDQGTIATNHFVQAVLPTSSSTVNRPTASTAITYEPANARVWVVNPDNNAVTVINATTQTRLKTITVGESPSTIAIAPNGNIWVTNKASATISIINPASLTVVNTIQLNRASQPHGLAFSPNHNQAFVVLEATGYLLKLNALSGSEIARISVGTNPRHVSVNHDTSRVFVSRFITPPLPGEATANVNTATAGGELIVVNPGNMTINKTIVLRHSDKADTQIQGSGVPNYLGAAVISPDNTKAWLPSKQDNIKRGTLRSAFELNFQNTVRAISSSINLNTLTENYNQRIDHDNASVGSAAVYHPDGVYAFVALETSREVAVIDAIKGFSLFKFSVGRAPQGLAISPDGKKLFVQNFMDRSVSIIDLTPLVDLGRMAVTNQSSVYTVPLSQEKLSPAVLLGKQLFYDAKDTRLARDSYMSCASCHNDGGQDGRVWDLTGFGEGLRNTIALKGRSGMGHGFLHWSANFDEVQDFENQIRTLAGGTGLMTDQQFNAGTRNQPLGDRKAGVSTALDELASYVASLNTFDESPYSNGNGALSASAMTGKQVFENKQCMQCHASNQLTNSLDASTLQNIGTLNSNSGRRLHAQLSGIDVPTLTDVWQTAPYLHNGSAQTITHAITAHSNNAINAVEIQHLVQYLLEVNHDIQTATVTQAVSLTSPTQHAQYRVGDTIHLIAVPNDLGASLDRILFYNGTTLLGVERQTPYTVDVHNAAIGNYVFTAKLIDSNGLETISAVVNATVSAVPLIAPDVSLTSPIANATYDAGETITLAATATDSDGSVASVSFYDGAILLARDTTVPYGFTLTNGIAGTHTFSAKAVDANGLEATSANIVVSVSSPNITTTPVFTRMDQNGNSVQVTSTEYTGTVDFLQYELLGNEGTDVIVGSAFNDFMNLLGGDDAANGGAGRDVLDGGTGSNFLTGGTEDDIFFIDGRGDQTTWSTITDFTPGDLVNMFGYIEGVSQLILIEPLAGATGYKGITYHYDLNNDGLIESSITFTGLSPTNKPVVSAQGQSGAVPYLLFSIPAAAQQQAKSLAAKTVNVDQTIDDATITDSPSQTAVFCANEMALCTIPNGRSAVVWFGAHNANYTHQVLSGTFRCGSQVFGNDPNIGLSESCHYVLLEAN